MAVIRIPKPPKRAFNTERPPSDLLKRQIEHLEWAVRPASKRGPHAKRIKAPRTEAEAAAHVERLTRILHPDLDKDRPTAAPVAVAPEPPAAQAKASKRRARRRRPRTGK